MCMCVCVCRMGSFIIFVISSFFHLYQMIWR
jgi:hypothetical protein